MPGFGEPAVNCIANRGIALEIQPPPSPCRGSRLTYHNIRYDVSIPPRCCGCFREAGKIEILHGVSGEIKPGLNAIMGPTGSGKTSLLDVLANRKDPKLVSGKVLLNGETLPKNFQYLSGYVVQNDLFVGTVTVREALWFCANMRLPASMPKKAKEQKIDSVIQQLGLTSCEHTKIGTATMRGISGGEKKRTSIAIEMMLDPKILFLDEPTTGLDAATASSVMRLLKSLGDEGNTIVCSIHQPRYSIFRLFDSLTLLSLGHLVYHGSGADVLSHFAHLGYRCSAHDNPADFLLDVLIGEYESNMIGHELNSEDESFGETKQDLLGLTEKFRDAVKNPENGEEPRAKAVESIDNIIANVKSSTKMYATGMWHQLYILLERTFKNIVRNPQGLLGNIALNIVVGIVFGLLYFDIYRNPKSAVQNIFGVLFFICTSLLFGSISAINAFTLEREIFIHEHVSGYYRIISYFLAKVLADLIPLRTVAPIIFCAITYWMVGLKEDAGAFFVFLLTSVLMGYASVGIGLFYSSSFQPVIAQLCLVLTFVFTIIFSGLLVNVEQMLPWLAWLKYLSVARYGLVGLSVNELSGRVFEICGNHTRKMTIFTSNMPTHKTSGFNSTCIATRGEDILFQSLSVGESPDDIGAWELWKNDIALFSICVVLYTLTYIQLVRVRKYS